MTSNSREIQAEIDHRDYRVEHISCGTADNMAPSCFKGIGDIQAAHSQSGHHAQKARKHVATEHPQMQAQELTHAAEVKEVHEVFEKMRAQSDQPRLRGVTGVCLFDIEGAGSWRVSINDGKLTVAEGHEAALPPTSVIKVSAHDFLRIFHREHHLNLYSALMQGLFTVSGDSAFASALLTTAIWPTQALHR